MRARCARTALQDATITQLQCYTFLGEASPVAAILSGLLAAQQGTLALQLAFTLYDNATQSFLNSVAEQIVDAPPASSSMAVDATESSTDPVEGPSQAYQTIAKVLAGHVSQPLYVQFLSRASHADALLLTRTKVGNRGSHLAAVTHRRTMRRSATSCATPRWSCRTGTCSPAPLPTRSCATTRSG